MREEEVPRDLVRQESLSKCTASGLRSCFRYQRLIGCQAKTWWNSWEMHVDYIPRQVSSRWQGFHTIGQT